MTIHVLRDYTAAASGYFAPGGGVNYFYTPYFYNLSLFLNKVLGYSIIGQNAWDINNTNVQTFSNANTVAIAAGSNGQTLPQSTIFTANTTGFPNSGVIFVSASVSTTVAAGSNGAVLPQTTINVASTATFLPSGSIQVVTTSGTQTVSYTGTNGTQFTGCTGGTGTMVTGNAVTSTAPQIVNYTGLTTGAFLNCTGGSGTMSSGQATTTTGIQALPTGTINVASTTGFPTGGTIYVVTTNGVQTVTYTGGGGGGTTFTGCTGGTGNTANGNAVTSAGGSVACGQLKVITNTGTPSTITTNFPHGLSNGQYVTVVGTTTPWPVNVLNITQFQLITTASSVGVAGAVVYPPGMLLASGTVAGGKGASINVTGASSVYAVSIPPNVRVVQAGTAPSTGDVGRILILKSSNYPTKNSGLFKISAVNTGTSTTIAAGSNNQTLPQGTINVASTTGFPASGTIFVYTSTGVQTVTYTGGGGGGTTFTGCSGGTGTMSTGNTVNNFNGYNIDYRSSDTPPSETMDWWLYEIETQTSFYVGYPNNSLVAGLGLLSTTNTAPIQVNTNLNVHGDWRTGQVVTISGVTVNTNANGTWTITVPSPTTTSGVFTLNGSVGNGTSGATGAVTRNGYTGGDNLSFNSKIILQSPHSSGWQVRLAVEPFNITNSPNTSVTVGYGGSSGGDWPVGGTHTHLPQFLDINVSNVSPGLALVGTIIGCANTGGIAIRTTMIGDDTGQAVFCYTRSQGAGTNGLVTFGIPDNEPSPPPPNTNRVFAYGGVNTSDFAGIQMRMGNSLNNFGLTFRDSTPEACAIAGWANVDGVSGTSPVYSANAGDSPFTGTTEVLPWEIWGGVLTDPSLSIPFNTTNGPPPYGLNQRFMGTAPYLRQGRANFGTFTLSTDTTTSLSVSGATTTAPIQITTSTTNALTTGQTVVISGITGNTAANGTFVITVIDNTHFTLNGTNGVNPYTGGGTVNGTAHWLHLQNGIYLQWNGAGGLTP